MGSSPSLNFPSWLFLSVLHAQSKKKMLGYGAYSLAYILARDIRVTQGMTKELFNDKAHNFEQWSKDRSTQS